MRTAFSVGSDSASSFELVCSDCVPPSTAANAWYAVRTMLFSGCCAVSVEPAVCVWKRSIIERGSCAWKRACKRIYIETSINSSLYIANGVGKRKGYFLNRGRACLAYVIAANAYGIPTRKIRSAVAEHISDDAHRMLRGVDISATSNVLFQYIILHRARELAHLSALFFCNSYIQREQDTGRGIYRHRSTDAFKR